VNQTGERFILVRGPTKQNRKVMVTVGETTVDQVYVKPNSLGSLQVEDEVMTLTKTSSSSKFNSQNVITSFREWLEKTATVN
jgi:hypothetical protein